MLEPLKVPKVCHVIIATANGHVTVVHFNISWYHKARCQHRFLALKAHKQGMPYTGTWPCKRQDRDQGHWQRNRYLILSKGFSFPWRSMLQERQKLTIVHPLLHPLKPHLHNNSNSKKHLERFPADDELGTCRTSRVSPEQPVLCVPVEFAHLADQHANKLQHLDATVCTKRANPKHYTKQLLVCAGYVDFDAKKYKGTLLWSRACKRYVVRV